MDALRSDLAAVDANVGCRGSFTVWGTLLQKPEKN